MTQEFFSWEKNKIISVSLLVFRSLQLNEVHEQKTSKGGHYLVSSLRFYLLMYFIREYITKLIIINCLFC